MSAHSTDDERSYPRVVPLIPLIVWAKLLKRIRHCAVWQQRLQGHRKDEQGGRHSDRQVWAGAHGLQLGRANSATNSRVIVVDAFCSELSLEIGSRTLMQSVSCAAGFSSLSP